MFSVEWLGHRVALKANNGKYICTKKNGQLLAVSDSVGKRPFFCTHLLTVTPPGESSPRVPLCQARTSSSP